MEGKFSYGRTDAVCDSVAGGGKTWLSMITAVTEAEIKGKVGWHTFRHSYRAWLQKPGAPLAAQQELMRHASIRTTMSLVSNVLALFAA